eukprot:5393932-Pyramimonas_sp.AAC.1
MPGQHQRQHQRQQFPAQRPTAPARQLAREIGRAGRVLHPPPHRLRPSPALPNFGDCAGN